jgi:hypothetical protein
MAKAAGKSKEDVRAAIKGAMDAHRKYGESRLKGKEALGYARDQVPMVKANTAMVATSAHAPRQISHGNGPTGPHVNRR